MKVLSRLLLAPTLAAVLLLACTPTNHLEQAAVNRLVDCVVQGLPSAKSWIERRVFISISVSLLFALLFTRKSAPRPN